MNRARRRFIQRTLGVAGYVAVAVAVVRVVPVVAATSDYAYRTAAYAAAAAAAEQADDDHMAKRAVTGSVAADIFKAAAAADHAGYIAANRDFIAKAAVADGAQAAAVAAWDRANVAWAAKDESGMLLLRVSVFFLTPLAFAAACFWARRFLALGEVDT